LTEQGIVEPITACGNGIRPDHVRYKPWFIEELDFHNLYKTIFYGYSFAAAPFIFTGFPDALSSHLE
jgi:hypothetical protein